MYFLPEKEKLIRGNPGEQEGPNIRRFDVDVNIKNLHTVTDSETSIRHGQRIKLTPVISGADSTTFALLNDYLIGIKDMAVQRNIQLPKASVAGAGKVFMVKDMVGGANTTNIVIAAVEGETIDGSASTTLSTNYDSKSLVSDGTNWYTGVYVPSGGGGVQYDIYTSSDTWTKPTGAVSVKVQIWGGGGSGAATTTSSIECGGGGGGGYAEFQFDADDLSATETVTIGAGGAAQTTADGVAGGNSTFGSHLTAYGGGGGGNGSSGGGGGGGAGPMGAGGSTSNAGAGTGGSPGTPLSSAGGAGTTATPPSDAMYGAGGGQTTTTPTAVVGGNAFYGGGGGGGAGQLNAAAGGTSVVGGAGGAGNNSASGNATSGTQPAGGGGAKWSNSGSGNSGAGGDGLCIVTTFF